MSKLRVLDRVSIPRPCQADWNEMEATANGRFCQSCQRRVHDFSTLTRREAADLIEKSAGKLCGRITYDQRGRIAFREESNGLFTNLRGWVSHLVVLGISALGSEAVSAAQPQACQVEVKVTDESGAVIPGAEVTVKPQAGTQAGVDGVTGPEGVFSGSLPAGEYGLGVKATGFHNRQARDVRVNCDLQLPVNIKVPLQLSSLGGDVVVLRPAPSTTPWLKIKSFIRRVLG